MRRLFRGGAGGKLNLGKGGGSNALSGVFLFVFGDPKRAIDVDLAATKTYRGTARKVMTDSVHYDAVVISDGRKVTGGAVEELLAHPNL